MNITKQASGIYHAERQVPKDARHIIGKSKLTVSLRTRDKRTANPSKVIDGALAPPAPRCANADIRMTIGQRAKNLPCVAERVDRTTTKYGVREMWKYGSGYIWVEDGVVTAISGD